MKRDRWFLRKAVLLCLCGLLAAALAAKRPLAVGAGSSSDPLVTLSYLNDTFLSQILQKVDERIAARSGQSLPAGGTSGSGEAASFAVVTLSQGQTLTGEVGCEVMLRIGSASCVAASDPGLVDETSGGILSSGGALETNHLYLMTIGGRGVRAASATVKLMVRGSYQIA